MSTVTNSDFQDTRTGVLKKSIHGGAWLTIGFIFQKIIGLTSFIILGRLLLPSDFGIIALVLLVPKLVDSFSDTGISNAIIQEKGTVEKYLNPLWTFGILKSTIIAICIFIAGPIIAKYLHAEPASLAIRLGGFLIMIQSFANIGEIFFFKDLDFKKVFLRNLSGDLVYTIVGIIAVLITKTYWALVIATAASYLAETLSTYLLHKHRPRFTLSFGPLRDLIGYSKWIVGQNMLSRVYGLLESTILTRTLNLESLGLFSKAKSLASVAPGMLSPLFNVISFPAYVRLQNEPLKIKDGITKSFDLLFFILVPGIFLVTIAGGKLILIVLGEKWLPMTNALRILFIYYSLGLLANISQSVLNAMGKPKMQASLSLLNIALTILLLIPFTIMWGITGSAIAILIGMIPLIVLSYISLTKIVQISIRDIANSAMLPLLSSILVFLPTIIWKKAILAQSSPTLLILLACSGLLYLSISIIIGSRSKSGPMYLFRTIYSTFSNK